MSIDINSSDVQLALRSKNSICVDGVPINHVPFSIITSSNIGYTKYSNLLSIFCVTEEKVKEMLKNDVDVHPIALICLLCQSDKKFYESVVDSCVLFFGKTPVIDSSNFCIKFYDDNTKLLFEINSTNYEDISTIVKLRNGILPKEESEMSNPASEKARQIIARRNEIHKKRAKAFSDKNRINTWDIIDIYTAVSKIPYAQVMEYDPFQLSKALERVKAFDDYEVGVQSLLHGAKKSDVNLKHWLSPIDKNEEQKDDE